MNHLPILPVLIPFLAAGLLLALHGIADTGVKRAVSTVSILLLLPTAALMLAAASDGTIRVYRLGDWSAPFGIILVVDRLAALMVALTAFLAGAALLSSIPDHDVAGRHFHVFLNLQVAGLNGAFLTGDLFNLFVFFEILLLASYALLMHGGGLRRARAGLAYVVLNLVGSALFLIALGLTYGALGTINMADLAMVLPSVTASDQGLVRTILALLSAVFLLKSALLPLGFWLPHVYSAATLPVAVLFVIMTKVGVYALLRVATLGFSSAPFSSDLLAPWLLWLAIGTIAFGCLGALAAKCLSVIVSNIVLISSGTLLMGVAAGSVLAHAATLYYLIQTTIVSAGLFLTAALIAQKRGTAADTFEKGPRPDGFMVLGSAYFILAVAASGLPPLSGFLGKLMLMQALKDAGPAPATWAALLISGLIVGLVMARAASAFFWEIGDGRSGDSPAKPERVTPREPRSAAAALIATVAGAVLVTVSAAPIADYARATADQLALPTSYVGPILGGNGTVFREQRP